MKRKKYSVEVVKPDIEISENLDFHETGWKIQRAGWILIILMVVLAGGGMFGNGFLSKSRITVADMQLEYERFFRFEAMMELRLHLKADAGGAAEVAFPADYLKDFRMENILPEPGSAEAREGKIHYRFEGSGPRHITFRLVPRKQGFFTATLDVNRRQMKIHHLIFP